MFMLNGSKQDDDGVINLRHEAKSSGEAEFKISHVEDTPGPVGPVQSMPISELEAAAMKPYDKVKVKFDKFVNLVATHAYEEVFEKHMDDDVIISTDLLTDLANAHEEKSDKKIPFILIGVLLGVGVAWLILKN